MKRSPIKRRTRTKHQERNLDHGPYKNWIAQQPCAACGTRKNVQVAHVGRGGMGMKHGSDAEVIPLCGLRYVITGGPKRAWGKPIEGCHQQHDQLKGQFAIGVNWSDRAAIRAWDARQVAVHRGRFEARSAVGFERIPF